MATVDSVGRRPLLLGGVAGILVALLALATAQLALGGSAATWTSVAALLLYVGCYQVSSLTAFHHRLREEIEGGLEGET